MIRPHPASPLLPQHRYGGENGSRDRFRAQQARRAEKEAELKRAGECLTRAYLNAWDSIDEGDTRKYGILPINLKKFDSSVMAPLYDEHLAVKNILRSPFGDITDTPCRAPIKGLFWHCGLWLDNGRPSGGPIVVTTTVLGAGRIHKQTLGGVAASITLDNLDFTAGVMRRLFPERDLIIAVPQGNSLDTMARRTVEAVARLHRAFAVPIFREDEVASVLQAVLERQISHD